MNDPLNNPALKKYYAREILHRQFELEDLHKRFMTAQVDVGDENFEALTALATADEALRAGIADLERAFSALFKLLPPQEQPASGDAADWWKGGV